MGHMVYLSITCTPNYPTLETLFKCEHALYFIALTKFKDKDTDYLYSIILNRDY